MSKVLSTLPRSDCGVARSALECGVKRRFGSFLGESALGGRSKAALHAALQSASRNGQEAVATLQSGWCTVRWSRKAARRRATCSNWDSVPGALATGLADKSERVRAQDHPVANAPGSSPSRVFLPILRRFRGAAHRPSELGIVYPNRHVSGLLTVSHTGNGNSGLCPVLLDLRHGEFPGTPHRNTRCSRRLRSRRRHGLRRSGRTSIDPQKSVSPGRHEASAARRCRRRRRRTRCSKRHGAAVCSLDIQDRAHEKEPGRERASVAGIPHGDSIGNATRSSSISQLTSTSSPGRSRCARSTKVSSRGGAPVWGESGTISGNERNPTPFRKTSWYGINSLLS